MDKYTNARDIERTNQQRTSAESFRGLVSCHEYIYLFAFLPNRYAYIYEETSNFRTNVLERVPKTSRLFLRRS